MGSEPRVRTEYPYPVATTENVWIEMSDGARLSARLRRPEVDRAVPAVLEYLPYRKDDGTLVRDNIQHHYLAGHGLACVRVDVRGSGDSDGALRGEYLATELDDGVEVIDWIAGQPWCNGNVGMMGISWGGFNSLQIAAKRPPALRAVLSVASTVDRYATDVHYKGGCLLAGDMLPWSTTMSCFNARPPTPRIVGDAWRRQWLERMSDTPIFVHDWLDHQRRDDFWKHGSVCQDFGAIDCPVMIVGGWADGYTDTVFHLIEGLTGAAAAVGREPVPWRGIIGPWSHNYPAVGVPGPNIGFLQEAVNWFARHLEAVGSEGIVVAADGARWDQPLQIWLQDRIEPSSDYPERPGRWIGDPSWPSPHVVDTNWWLVAGDDPGRQSGTLLPAAPAGHNASGTNTQTSGLHQGSWWGYAQPGQLPADQRLEEPAAFRFVGPRLAEPVNIVGLPTVQLRLQVDAPLALVAVRLCDVGPDGSSLQLSRGVLNLAHRDGHQFPEAVVPGEPMTVTVTLDGVAHAMPADHRLELHVGTSLWPLVWPSPTPVELSLHFGAHTVLTLPVRSEPLGPAIEFGSAEVAPSGSRTWGGPAERRAVSEDLGTGTVTLTDHTETEEVLFDEHNHVMASSATDTWIINRHDPLSARVRCERVWSVHWPDVGDGRLVEVRSEAEMWCDAQNFYTTDTVSAVDGDEVVFTKTWERSYRRDHV